MRRWASQSGNGRRPPFPESTPPEINHVVLTGTLTSDPQEGRSPTGDPVTLLRIAFPVRDPERSDALWTRASCEVEVPGDLARRDAEELRSGVRVIVAGQISERRAVEGAVASRRSVIVAFLVKSGPPPEEWDAFDEILPA
jgi:single-stranded DNA-binding protein